MRIAIVRITRKGNMARRNQKVTRITENRFYNETISDALELAESGALDEENAIYMKSCFDGGDVLGDARRSVDSSLGSLCKAVIRRETAEKLDKALRARIKVLMNKEK